MADVVSRVRVTRAPDDNTFESWLHDESDAYRIHRACYRREEILEQEKERIFARTWNLACLTSEVPAKGDYFTLEVADHPVLVVRGRDGEIRAFQNACTHRGALVTDNRRGSCGAVFKCMYHVWSFDLEGKLVGVPYPEAYGEDFDRSQLGLVPVRCETFGDLVFVNLSNDTPSLREYLGDFAPHIEPQITGIEAIGRNSWIYDGNWKLWHENARDNYHPQFTHRWINDTMPKYAERGGNWGFDNGHAVLQWVTPPPYPDPSGYQKSVAELTGVEFDVTQMTQFDEIWAPRRCLDGEHRGRGDLDVPEHRLPAGPLPPQRRSVDRPEEWVHLGRGPARRRSVADGPDRLLERRNAARARASPSSRTTPTRRGRGGASRSMTPKPRNGCRSASEQRARPTAAWVAA